MLAMCIFIVIFSFLSSGGGGGYEYNSGSSSSSNNSSVVVVAVVVVAAAIVVVMVVVTLLHQWIVERNMVMVDAGRVLACNVQYGTPKRYCTYSREQLFNVVMVAATDGIY